MVVTFKIQLFQTPRSHYHMLHQKRKIFSLVIGNSSTISRNNVKKKFKCLSCPSWCLFVFFFMNICARTSFRKVWCYISNSRITNVWRGFAEVLPFSISICVDDLIVYFDITQFIKNCCRYVCNMIRLQIKASYPVEPLECAHDLKCVLNQL